METQYVQHGRLACIRLNRPQVLNALAPDQFAALHGQLAAWAEDDSVGAILLEGAGERAFCAGGDIRAVWDARARGDDGFNRHLFRDEYRLDRLIHHYAKPIVSALDGIVMGGGAGISINGRFRVATERSVFAMPEAAIGFFPDVGATHFLSRCPGAIGLYLGLTGARLRAADMLWAGLATHYVPTQSLEALTGALADAAADARPADAIAATLAAFHRDPGPSPLATTSAAIEHCFAAPDVQTIMAAVDMAAGEWAATARAALAAASPTSLAVIFHQLTAGRCLEFDAAIAREYGMACRFLACPDFYEGIRAVVVDKDRAPKWQPDSLALLSNEMVAEYFAPCGDDLLS